MDFGIIKNRTLTCIILDIFCLISSRMTSLKDDLYVRAYVRKYQVIHRRTLWSLKTSRSLGSLTYSQIHTVRKDPKSFHRNPTSGISSLGAKMNPFTMFLWIFIDVTGRKKNWSKNVNWKTFFTIPSLIA